MKLYVDLDKLELIEGPGFRNPVSTLRFKRGDAARLEVMFLANGSTATTIGDPATLEIHFGAKLNGQYGTDYLVHSADWTMPEPEATTPVYACFPSFNTVALNDALALGGTELSEITLMGELTWREGTGEPTSTRTVLVVVDNDVNRGTEGTPVSGPTPEAWLDSRAVRHDAPQTLSEAAKLLARTNTGTGSGSDAYATTKLINAGELLLDDSITIGDLTYTMVATPSGTGEVLGESGMQPVIDAINGDALNAPHPAVMASDAGGGDMLIRALVKGPEGNGILVDYSPYGAGSAYWEEGATIGGGNSLLEDTMGASSRLTGAAQVEDVSTGFLLVQKAQDNARFASFSLLILWSWIKSKLDLALTLAGTKTFTGQLELTNQAATNPTSALTVKLLSGLLGGLYEWSKNPADYTAAVVGGGSSSLTTGVLLVNAGATAGSNSVLYSDGNNFRSWQRGGNPGRGVVNWSKRTVHHVKLASDTFTGADTVIRIMLGFPNTVTTPVDFSVGHKGIGIKVVNGLIHVQVANGAAVSTTSTGVTIAAWDEYDITIESSGTGAWTAAVNDTTVSGTGAPTGTTAANSRSLVMSITNGTTAATKRFFINSMKTLQF